MIDPKEIYQEVLDKLSVAIMAGDERTFMRHITVPHYVETQDEKITIETEEEAREKFHTWSKTLRSSGVTDYVRICDDALEDGEDRIKGRHTSHLLHSGECVRPPFPSAFELERIDGFWMVRRVIQNAAYVTWPDLLPKVSLRPEAVPETPMRGDP